MNKQTKLAVLLSLSFVAIFCTSFVFFYSRAQQKKPRPAVAPEEVGQVLPHAELIDKANAVLKDEDLRKGKVVLAFVQPDCNACNKESAFLKTVVGRRDDVSFYGVIPFGDRQTSLESAERKYPFKVYYDEGYQLGGSLQITSVPVKLFVEDGVIKKVWEGASVDPAAQQEFVQWLTDLR